MHNLFFEIIAKASPQKDMVGEPAAVFPQLDLSAFNPPFNPTGTGRIEQMRTDGNEWESKSRSSQVTSQSKVQNLGSFHSLSVS